MDDKITALNDLMITYERDVWNFAFSLVRRQDLADDVTQDVFIKAYEKLDKFRGDSSIKTWLLAITRNCARNYQRTAFFRKVVLMESISNQSTHPSAETEALASIVAKEVWQAVLRLPAKLREVLVLQLHHQLTISEIAQLTKMSESGVKSRLHRAKRKVAKSFPEEGDLYAKPGI